MKAITVYDAPDGSRFKSEAACLKYESECAEIAAIMREIPERPKLKECGFDNGAGYLQHNPIAFKQVRHRLLEVANRLYPHKWFTQSMEDDTIDASWAARMMDEINHRALQKAWHRVWCTDSQYREWGQPYYAMHPTEGKQVAL